MDIKNIACIILAAGEGKRFGKPKWEAEYEGSFFLEIILDKLILSGLTDICCVVRNGSIPPFSSLQYVINPNPERGMSSSLYYGVNMFSNRKGFIVLPVDHPFFSIDTIKGLITAFISNPKCVIKPVNKGRGGHPIILPSDLAYNIPEGDFPGGLKMFIKKSNLNIFNVNVSDEGVLRNINYITDI